VTCRRVLQGYCLLVLIVTVCILIIRIYMHVTQLVGSRVVYTWIMRSQAHATSAVDQQSNAGGFGRAAPRLLIFV
jgi:hypothetical protein